MIYVIIAFFLIFSKIPLTRFQFLLLLCLIETKTGFLIGDYYTITIIFFYLWFRYLWWRALYAPVAQRN